MSDTPTVFVVDDHGPARDAVIRQLDESGLVQVVGSSDGSGDTLAAIVGVSPDVALVDARLGHRAGFEICYDLFEARPDIASVLQTASSQERAFAMAWIGRASGFVLKEIRQDNFVTAVQEAIAGQLLSPLTGDELDRLVYRLVGSEQGPDRDLLINLFGQQTNRSPFPSLDSAQIRSKQIAQELLYRIGLP